MSSTRIGSSSLKIWNDHCYPRQYSKLKTVGYKPLEKKTKQFVFSDLKGDFFGEKSKKQFVFSDQKRDLLKEIYTTDTAELYQEVSSNYLQSLIDDINKIKNRRFTDGWVTAEYGENSFTPFFLINFASKMLDQVPGCEKIAKECEETITTEDGWKKISMLNYYYPPEAAVFSEIKGGRIIADGNAGIKIRQTPSNNKANIISPKLVEGLKKSSEIFFKKLYEICVIPDLNIDNSLPDKEKLEKYKSKCALVIDGEERKNLGAYQSVVAWLLKGSGLSDKVDFLNYDAFTGIYGEKKDIQKFITILYAQQFPNTLPSIVTRNIE